MPGAVNGTTTISGDAPGSAHHHGDRTEAPLARWLRRFGMLDGWSQASLVLEAVLLVGATAFVLAQLGPGHLFSDTTTAGGDMGAHVWGPAYLRDNLLSEGRLSGWAPDWYAGFPAYQFYMVVPALLVVLLDVGLSGWAALLPLATGLGLIGVALTDSRRRRRRLAFVAGLLVVALGAGLPYAVAFKLVTVSGLLALPACCYAAARLADLPFPGPPLAALGSMVFLFNREPTDNSTGHIIGGNVASTLAGEFSFSISLAFLVLYLGFLLRGLRSGGHRATCAVLLALCALCHVIPAIYAVVATAAAVVASWPLHRRRLAWFLPVGPVAVSIAAFWVGPFVLRRGYLNDMGWEKIPTQFTTDAGVVVPGITRFPVKDFLWRMWWDDSPVYAGFRDKLHETLLPTPLTGLAMLALIGAVVSFLLRIRIGVVLTLCAAATAVLFVVTPQGRLWNARLLPFWLLCLCLLAAIGVAELGRAVAGLVTRRPDWRVTPVSFATPAAAALFTVVYVGLPLGVIGQRDPVTGNEELLVFESRSGDADTLGIPGQNVVDDWARWNYSGYEEKAAYPEYHDLVTTMEGVVADPELGCGRAMWEYESARLDRYGTPMAPMLLPFWTDGCIGSMEGLFFEASSTTPYHFLNQRALSANCSCAQRDLPYGTGFEIDLGVQQLRVMGVRYYLAFTETAVTAADGHPDLTEVAVTSDDVWHVYLVDGSDAVVPLTYEPVVLTDVEPGMSWVGAASKWFQDPSRWDVFLAEDGLPEWDRVAVGIPVDEGKGPDEVDTAPRPTWTELDVLEEPELRRLADVEVSAVEVGRDGISFDVSEPGVPVLVKASYFPNWQTSGAEGPFRVTPNLMVVVPTDTHVELSYGVTGVDVGSYALTGIGLAAAVVLVRRPGRRTDLDGTRLLLDGPEPGWETAAGADPPADPRSEAARPGSI